jgi:integrase
MAKTTELLSILKIKTLTTPGRHSDGGGLYLVVRPKTATKSWTFLFRDPFSRDKRGNGRPTECGLGSYPFVSAKQARAKAAEGRDLLSENPPRNPKTVWAEQRRASNVPTFSEMADQFLARMGKDWKSGRHLERVRANLENQCRLIADKPIDQITVDDVLNVVNTYAQKAPTSATKLRGTIEQVWNYAQDCRHIGRDQTNPAIRRRKKDLRWAPTPKAEHHVAMPYSELPAFMGKLRAVRQDAEGRINVCAHALEFAILTAGRSGEIRLARWEEIDLVNRLWSIPGKRMKTGAPHVVPITNSMLEILEAMRPLCRSDYIFPGTKLGQPLTAKSFERLLARLGAECVCHGFRSTFRNWAGNKTNTEREICEMALAHKVKDATERAYWREHPLEKHRVLLEQWDRYLSPHAGNVVNLRSA